MSLDTDRLMNNARIHLPGAIDANIQLELFNVLNDFFQNSNVWKEDITFKVTPASNTYSVENESVASIVRLLALKNSSNFDVAATMFVPGEVVLNTTPAQADTLTVTVALTVNDPIAKDGFPEFPAWVLNKYGTGILDGVIGRMLAQPAKPWTNVQLAGMHLRKFSSAISDAKAEAVHANLNNGQTWRFPRSFATRRR